MTVLGKILVILNLVFCLFTGGLIVVAYATRTNWHAYAKKVQTEQAVAEANARTYADRLQQAQRDLGEAVAARDVALKDVQAVQKKVETDMADLRRQVQEGTQNTARADSNLRVATEEAK